MKNWNKVLFSIVFSAVYAVGFVSAQNIDKISKQCKAPNTSVFGNIFINARGDNVHTPCPARSNIFNGNVDFTNATIIGAGFVTGTGTVNFLPRWTAATVLGDTPLSWNGSSFVFNNTALNATFTATLRPSSTVGFFNVGNVATNFNVTQLTNTISNQVDPATGVWQVTDATNFSTVFNANANTWNIINTTTDNRIAFNSVASGGLTLGDCTSTITECFNQSYSTGNTSLSATQNMTLTAGASYQVQDSSGSLTLLTLNTAGELFDVKAQQGITLDSGAESFRVGDTSGVSTSSIFTLNATTGVYTFSNLSGEGAFNWTDINNFRLQCTNTASGTTGNQTINKPCGSVNFAAAASDIVVTNSMALATSNILCTVQGLDGTAISCRITNRANGSFHIRVPVATAETPVSFWVLN
jgi:hypothetical protein